jgi:hypothetical protein
MVDGGTKIQFSFPLQTLRLAKLSGRKELKTWVLAQRSYDSENKIHDQESYVRSSASNSYTFDLVNLRISNLLQGPSHRLDQSRR